MGARTLTSALNGPQSLEMLFLRFPLLVDRVSLGLASEPSSWRGPFLPERSSAPRGPCDRGAITRVHTKATTILPQLSLGVDEASGL